MRGDSGRVIGTLTLLWLAGMGLRLTILAAAPVLPMIHRDLNLTETAIGTLGSLPSLLFAFAAVPGALLIARFGARATLVAGLILTAVGSAARGAAPDILILDGATILMGAGIAIMQPTLPPLVREWMPNRIGFATAVYTNGLLVSEIIAVAAAVPIVLPLVRGSWRLSFVVWALPVLLTAALVVWGAPGTSAASRAARGFAARRWWPNWRHPLVWRLGIMLGGVNTIYWSANTFLPDYLYGMGRGDLVVPVLSALNGGQLPGSLLMLAIASRVVRSRAIYVVLGALILASVFGIVVGSGNVIVALAAIVGCANAVALVLMLALPALVVPVEDVPRMSAAMFTVSYPCAVVLPILGGFAWDETGIAAVAFAPAALGAIAILALGPGIRFD
ncbi:MAG TPA: MFS transporter, partial [Stellaceae bacterium]|nr:MFS transporter [Stellaceae bacterium]